MAKRNACRAFQRAVSTVSRGSAPQAPAQGAQRQLLQQIVVPAARAFSSPSAGFSAASSNGRSLFPAAAAVTAAAVTAFAASGVVSAGEVERTFIAIKPDGVQRGLISDVIERFERKGYKLVGIKLIKPTKAFAGQHYDDLKGRPFFDGLTDFLSSGPVVAMVWEGPGVIKYGRKMIGATNPQASEPGTIRGDLAVVVGRNIIHGSDGPETAVNEVALWFKPEELVDYNLDAHKWVYE